MSEDTGVGTSHLCTTEDAFEQFQAVSMYEEDDYVTLADIVPPQPSVPDYGILSQIPYDNEVVLTTSNDPEGSIVKDTTGEIEQPIQQDSNITHLDSSDSKDAGQKSDINIKPQQPKRRGRKKKNDNIMAINSDSKDIMIEKSSDTHSNGLPVKTRPKRRGRPVKKSDNPEISTFGVVVEDPITTPNKILYESSSSLMIGHGHGKDADAVKTPNQVRKRRGRPPVNKISSPKSTKISDDQLLSAADSTTLLLSEKCGSEYDKVDDNMIANATPRKRRTRRVSTEFMDHQAQPSDGSLSENNASLNYIGEQSKILSSKNSPAKRFKRNKVEEQVDILKIEKTGLGAAVQAVDNKLLNDPGTLENDKLDEISLSQLKHVADDDSTLLSSTNGTAEENYSKSNPQNYVHAFSDFVNKLPQRINKGRGRRKKNIVSIPQSSEKLDTVKETPVNKTKQEEEDDADNLCLSQLKETIEPTIDTVDRSIEPSDAPPVEDNAIVYDDKLNINDDNGTSSKRNTNAPLMADFEYNIEGITNETNETVMDDPDQSLLVEDSSKRPIRRRVKQTLHYEQESDEDPFANLPSSSDDEPRKGRNRKGNSYHSDEEYYPGNKRGKCTTDTESDSEVDQNVDESRKQKKKVWRKKSETHSPQKRGKKTETNTVPHVSKVDDIEEVLQSSVITAGDELAQPLQAWGTSKEFESFIAKKIQGTDLKIKKVSSTEPSEKSITPLEIPVIDPAEKKTVEMCSQTTVVCSESTGVQTTSPFDIAMKEKILLTKEQSEKACQFLNNIVQTTAELGQLMTQKSEDFIKKKINTEHVTDTFKMDYCVRKSFLLFKLAKHNLMQMEEDLAKQYGDFLQSNKLSYCREKQIEISGKIKAKKENSDSDCEIVEDITPTPSTNKQKVTKFNPKTVFLNKELSIKIAKKPSEPQKPQKKIDIKGRHTVWISDTVMVKKVKPTQSFLAQDSRNKKPPDTFVTMKMVSDFFTKYYRQRALTLCAPFISTEWHNVSRECVCNYFVVQPVDFNAGANFSTNEGYNLTNAPSGNSVPNANSLNDIKPIVKALSSPEPLFKLCFRVLKTHLHVMNHIKNVDHDHSTSNTLTDGREQPQKLIKLCLKVLFDNLDNEQDSKLRSTKTMTDRSVPASVLPLKSLCYKRVVELGFNSNATYQKIQTEESQSIKCISIIKESNVPPAPSHNKNGMKSLFSLCVLLIQNQLNCSNDDCAQVLTPNTLKHIVFENIKYHLYRNSRCTSEYSKLSICQIGNDLPIGGLTINSVNTLSEEAFLNLEQPIDVPEISDYADDFENDDSNTYGDSNLEPDCDSPEDNVSDGTNWESQVQMQEPRSFPFNTCEDTGHNDGPSVTQIKLEPVDEAFESIVDPPVVKLEPYVGIDEMTIVPDIDPIKPEITEDRHPQIIERQNSSSYDVTAFENFVQSNKLMNSEEYSNEDIFSQSASRIRRQHEPDLYEENDMGMSLLVPQTYEPINIETAKGSLMETSSDESSQNIKSVGKKKIEKRSRGRPKKNNKTAPTPTVKDKVTNNEVAILTRRMRDKIRQEEKKDESSDSENESLSRVLRNKKDNNEKSKTTPYKNAVDTEIQCSNVDSTENVTDEIAEQFTGFTAIDQNETSSYQKFMKYVYDKIVPNVEEVEEQNITDVSPDKNISDVNTKSPVFESNEPIELLECEPTMPFFDDDETKTKKKGKDKKTKPVTVTENISFIERHGWSCYPVNKNDSKLYQATSIVLEKLPDIFVETYFQYRDIRNKDQDDEEVDRLTNLNTLKRNCNLKESKICEKSKRDKSERTSEHNSELRSRTASPENSDRYDELTPSEDESTDTADEMPTSAPKQTENILAKDSLMNDNDSDSDHAGNKIKQEPTEEFQRNTRASKNKSKVSPHKAENTDPDSLMLTADKVMNKELNLLHAPVVLDDDVKDITSKKAIPRSKMKSATKNQSMKGQMKSDDDSSSEEEKQWVNTKEKLLKRLGKKEDIGADDAKRAKLVSEFIERRADYPDSHKRPRGKGVRSRKKFLERQKQLKVLSQELFGETSIHNKRSAQAYFKGRRNIRKVIDKKSLARSTVIANMEEFERKRRLNSRQSRLRQLVGCEEGVNVLVINDEVCLEYDFEEFQPVVTIHPFFTKVMKAHQYEGVKFMWDACFESLSVVESGHAGGGCILAHCMGLGKTLQVLALLHTVLTHPRVGMRRVLVCCPLSTVLNWVDEIHKWLGPVTNAIKVFELSKLKKTYERAYQLEDWYNGGGIFIIGYELFRSLSTIDPLLDDVRPTIVNKIRMALLDPGPDIIVCDEGHLLKNDCSVLAVAMSRVATKRRIVLTGTPMQNNLREYYCMVDFVKPNLLGTYAEYSNRFENPIMNGQHRDSREEDIRLMKARTHILHKVLEGCLQRQEASVLYPYLPKKHEYTVFIPLTPCQWDMYKHYLNFYSRQGKHGILKDFHILHKIWSHPQVLHNFQTKATGERIRKAEKLEDDLAAEDLVEDIKPKDEELWWLPFIEGGKIFDSLEASNKFMVVFKILEECVALGDKMLLFSTSLFCLDGLEYFLKKINKWSLGQEYYRLDGSVPPEVRQKWCREFNAENNDKTKLFLVSTRAGCLGLNMTAANRVVILDTSWNPAHDIQSIFRVYRFGQRKDCYIYRLVAMGTMEQKIYERSVTKQAVACRVVDEQQIDRHYNSADLTELYGYDESGASVSCGVAAGVQDAVLLRVACGARGAALHAAHEHDSLLRGSEPALPEHERAAAWRQFQQEQQDKQVQNKLISIPKIPLKRIHGHEYAKDPVIAPQPVKVEDSSDDYVPPGPKSRKGKKVVKCCIPVNNDSSPAHVPTILKGANMRRTIAQYSRGRPSVVKSAEDPDNDFQQAGTSKSIPSVQIIGSKTVPNANHVDEEAMVQKISDILIKHKFQDRKMEIGSLIAQVRRLVAKENFKKNEMPDELSRSIAAVLLGDGCSSAPSVANIVCESLSTIVQRPAAELITGDLADKPQPKTEKDKGENHAIELNLTKGKRKAAIEAKKTIDTLVQDVINLDDDDDNFDGDGEYLPDVTHDEELEQNDPSNIQTKPASIIKTNNASESNKAPINKKSNDITPVTNDSRNKDIKTNDRGKEIEEPNSILLSDDEEPPVPAEASKASEDDEIVPLPRSLLTNKNFIKIVAHTYSAGNPMLDNDAATLAAQYSTFRALKESEETGKDIVSGPIYDIAINVLGKLTLKRLLTVNDNVKKSAEDTAALQFKENLQAFENDSSKVTEPTEPVNTVQSRAEVLAAVRNVQQQTTLPQPAAKIQSRYSADGRRIAKLVDSRANQKPSTTEMLQSAAPVAAQVVPVGLIKRVAPSQSYAAPSAPARDECILPDHDVRVAPARPPPLTPAPAPHQPTPAFTRSSAVDSKPLILNHILNTSRRNTKYLPQKPVTQLNQNQQPVIEIAMGKVVMPDANPPTEPGHGADTICLDSDEEETITPHVAHPAPAPPAPLPVPPLHMLQPTSKSTVLQNKLPQGAAQRKFVLVPASQVPPQIIKNVSESTKSSNPRPQSVPQTAKSSYVKIAPKETVATTMPSNFKFSKTTCKPGDIFRISKTGQIEVLGKDDEEVTLITSSETREPLVAAQKPTVAVHKPTVAAQKPTIAVQKPTVSAQKPTIAVQKPTVAAHKPTVAAHKPTSTHSSTGKKSAEPRARKATVSTSSTSSSRSSSPDNPLSILKDVVHIQAADDTPRKPPTVTKSIVTKTEKNLNTSLQHVHSKITLGSGSKLTKVGGDKNKSVYHIDMSNSTSEAGKSRDKSAVRSFQRGGKATNSGVSKTPVAVGSAVAKGKSFTKLADKATPTKVVGNLKNIVLEGSGKGVTVNTNKKPTSIDLTGQNAVQVTNIKKIPALAPIKTEAKKRPPTEANTSAATKKRKPMTLKDFDIDDLDDIIELD